MSTQITDTFGTGGRGSPNAWSPASPGNCNWTQVTGTSTMGFNQSSSLATLSGDTSANIMTLGKNLLYYTNVVAPCAKATAVTSEIGVMARVVSATTHYRATFINGTLTLYAVVAGVQSVLGTYAFTEIVATKYSVRLQIFGQKSNVVTARVWPTSGTEPTSWQITATDTSIVQPGSVGMYGQSASSGETLTYYSFTAADPATYPNQLGNTPYGMVIASNPGNDPGGITMLRDAVNAGYTWIRWIAAWSSIEKTVGVYTWTALDAAVQACNAQNINILVCIRQPPAWHLINPCGNSSYEIMDPVAAGTFATALMQHYNGGGGGGTIQASEWGNEDYSKGYGLCPTGDIAATLMANVYPAVKAIANIPVLGPATYLEKNLTPWWYDAFFVAGGGAYIDYFNVHSYPCPYGPDDPDPNSGNYTQIELAQILQGVAVSNGYPNLQAWITENAWACVTTNNGCIVTGSAQQSQFYQQELDMCRTSNFYTMHFWFDIAGLYLNSGITEVYRTGYAMLQVYDLQYPQWTQGSGPGSYKLLPGQRISNDVSNFLFGCNTPNYNTTLLTSTAVQAQLKANGITIIRSPVVDQNNVNYADSVLDQLATACANVGAALLLILRESDAVFSQHVVAYMGERCFLYEYGNEPDNNSIPVAEYISDWNTNIPIFRATNPRAAFIGPALGYFGNLASYLEVWLSACKASGVIPDGISWHDYPCTSQSPIPQATCSLDAVAIGNDGATLRAAVLSILGFTLPVIATEYNIDAYVGGTYGQSYSPNIPANASFISSWTTSAMGSLISNTVDGALQFELNDYLVSDSAPSTPEPQMQAINAEEVTYYGSISYIIGINCEITVDGTGYYVKPGTYKVKQPRVRKMTVRADNNASYVDLGPGKREWAMIILCKNDLLNYDGSPALLDGQQYRDALIASYEITSGTITFVDPQNGSGISVFFDNYVEAVLDLKTQQVPLSTGNSPGLSYEVAIVLVEA